MYVTDCLKVREKDSTVAIPIPKCFYLMQWGLRKKSDFGGKTPMSNSLFLPIIVFFKTRQRRKNILLERSMDLLHTSPPFSWTELIPCYYLQWDGNKWCKPLSLSTFPPCAMNWKQACGAFQSTKKQPDYLYHFHISINIFIGVLHKLIYRYQGICIAFSFCFENFKEK